MGYYKKDGTYVDDGTSGNHPAPEETSSTGAAKTDEMTDYYKKYYEDAQNNQKQLQNALAGGYSASPWTTNAIGAWNAGQQVGAQFLNDPRLQAYNAKLAELAKGYSGEELGGIRQTARGEIAGAAQANARKLQSQLARGGVGGARAAAMQGQQNLQSQQAINQAETKMALDSAQMRRQGIKDEGAQAMKELATKGAIAGGLASIESSGSASQKAAEAARSGGNEFCCFIFLEANNGVLDRIARRARNELMTDRNRRGYYKLSEVLVPLMRKYSSIKFLVTWLMVKPMIAGGKYIYGESKVNKIFMPFVNFWLKTFDYLGGEHPFLRENGEVV